MLCVIQIQTIFTKINHITVLAFLVDSRIENLKKIILAFRELLYIYLNSTDIKILFSITIECQNDPEFANPISEKMTSRLNPGLS
ncbi:hypothetical protein C7475_10214 [Chitinophaga sp. S165]|nr:hypothetical protein C7475_10214 [Chitinophaga sp. S165]